jgi:plastocyanin
MKAFVALSAFLALSAQALAADLPVYNLTAKDGHFEPALLEMPAGKKIQLVVKNEGPGAEEFESSDLNREKVVAPGKSITLYLGPLKEGTYSFFGDFHPSTAKGKIVVK